MISLKKLADNKVLQNFSYLTFGSFIGQLLSLITVLKITDFFSPEDYGLFTFIITQNLLLLAISELGTKKIFVRSISRNRQRTNDLIFNGLLLRILAVILLTAIYSVYNFYLGTLSFFQVFLIGACTFGNSFWDIFEDAFLGNQKMLYPSIIQIIYSILWFSSIFILPIEYFSVNNLITIFICLNLAQGIAQYFFLKKLKFLKGEISNFWKASKKILNESWPYFSVMLIMIPIQSFHNIYLELNSTVEEIGFFNLARRLLSPVEMILNYAIIAAFPSLSALWLSDQKKLIKIVKVGFKYLIVTGSVLSFLFALFVNDIVILLFSEKYYPAIIVTQMQVWYTFLMAINYTISIVLGAVDQEKLLFRFSLINAIISIPMLFYGSKYGAMGLASAYVISFAIMEIYLWITFKKKMKITIEKDLFVWSFAIVLFFIGMLIPNDLDIYIKIFLAILLIFPLILYLKLNLKKDYSYE